MGALVSQNSNEMNKIMNNTTSYMQIRASPLTSQRTFSSIQHTWHSIFVDYISLTMVKMLLPNVYEATTPRFQVPVIVKFVDSHGR